MELPIPPISGDGFAIRGRERRRRGGQPFALEVEVRPREGEDPEEPAGREHGDFAAPGDDEAGRRLDVSA